MNPYFVPVTVLFANVCYLNLIAIYNIFIITPILKMRKLKHRKDLTFTQIVELVCHSNLYIHISLFLNF